MTIRHFLLTITCLSLGITSAFAGGDPIFHLDFSSFEDVSGNALPTESGEAVSLLAGGGPTLASGRTLNAGRWDGEDDDTNQILILDHPLLDDVAITAGSIVTWVKVDEETEWNNLAKTICEDHIEPCDAFSRTLGIEFQASLHAGVFGAVQGWETNVFGPNAPQNGGDGTETPSGEWTHAALTWNDIGDHTIYVNGEPGPTIEGVGDDFDFGENDPGDWSIGGDGLNATAPHTDASRRLRGELADFAIFNGELTEAEIAEIMRSGVPSSGPGDFNSDGVFDVNDINALSAAVVNGANETRFDVNGDSRVDAGDIQVWVKEIANSWIGDANLDGEFNSSDFVVVFSAGKFEQDIDATWNEGDWNGSGRFDSGDFVVAFTDGGFELGPRPEATVVPEPNAVILLLLGFLTIGFRSQHGD